MENQNQYKDDTLYLYWTVDVLLLKTTPFKRFRTFKAKKIGIDIK